ncbi:hypothetical protein VME_45620 [Vibrio harveyi 1DA3]|nr:hypothetical protein VME_45620 [Vibrio harveyi 1DA3]
MFNINHALANGGISRLEQYDVENIEKELLDENFKLKITSIESIKSFEPDALRFFMWKYGIYSMPTEQLIKSLRDILGNTSKCLEIGAGNGVYGRSLDIKMTDNYMQHPKNDRKFRGVVTSYIQQGQPLVSYGDDVEEMDGKESVRLYKPETVFCSWVTQKYNPMQHEKGGNMFGVDFDWIFKRKSVKRVVMIGNEAVHQYHPIATNSKTIKLKTPHLISRASKPELDRIYILEV